MRHKRVNLINALFPLLHKSPRKVACSIKDAFSEECATAETVKDQMPDEWLFDPVRTDSPQPRMRESSDAADPWIHGQVFQRLVNREQILACDVPVRLQSIPGELSLEVSDEKVRLLDFQTHFFRIFRRTRVAAASRSCRE